MHCDYMCLGGFLWAKEQVPGKATQETAQDGLKKNITVLMRLVDGVIVNVMVVNHYLLGGIGRYPGGYFGRIDRFTSGYVHISFRIPAAASYMAARI